MNPKSIVLHSDVALRLLSYASATRLEFSGFGFCRVENETIFVYDFELLHVGNPTFTEIQPEKIVALMSRSDAANMKVWVHKHPVGNGVPGPHNWSGMDNQTIAETPLGGFPEMVKWSASIVITPSGWVGRIDNHLTKQTRHLEVYPTVRPFHAQIADLTPEAVFVQGGWEDWEEEALPIEETCDQRVLEVASFFTDDDMAVANFTREDLLGWIEDDLEMYDGPHEGFVQQEKRHLRQLLGELK
jgi:hypothetical protein